MEKENVVNTFFLTRKELQNMSLVSSILDLNLDFYSFYRLEISLLPISYSLDFGYRNPYPLKRLICLERNEFYFCGDIANLYGVILSMVDVSVEQCTGFLLGDEGVVCHDIYIATLIRISR